MTKYPQNDNYETMKENEKKKKMKKKHTASNVIVGLGLRLNRINL